jgi:hypothetical protein
MVKNKVGTKNMLFFVVCVAACYTLTLLPRPFLSAKQETRGLGFKEGYSLFLLDSLVVNGAKIDEPDKIFLYKLLPEKAWKSHYNPYLANTIVFSPDLRPLNREASNKVFELAVKYALANPMLTLQHVARADNMLWNINPDVYIYVYDFNNWGERKEFASVANSKLPMVRKAMIKQISISSNNSLLQLILYRPALYMYLSIMGVVWLVIMSRRRGYVLIILPMILNTLSLIPTNLAQDLRYVYINYLTFFFVAIMLCCYGYRLRTSKVKKLEQ